MFFQESKRDPWADLMAAKALLRPKTVVGHPEDIARLRGLYDWDTVDGLELQESRFANKGTLMVFDPAKSKSYDIGMP